MWGVLGRLSPYLVNAQALVFSVRIESLEHFEAAEAGQFSELDLIEMMDVSQTSLADSPIQEVVARIDVFGADAGAIPRLYAPLQTGAAEELPVGMDEKPMRPEKVADVANQGQPQVEARQVMQDREGSDPRPASRQWQVIIDHGKLGDICAQKLNGKREFLALRFLQQREAEIEADIPALMTATGQRVSKLPVAAAEICNGLLAMQELQQPHHARLQTPAGLREIVRVLGIEAPIEGDESLDGGRIHGHIITVIIFAYVKPGRDRIALGPI